jgi:Arc/MetJ-type ribon-helix-helix transcriptional regulator
MDEAFISSIDEGVRITGAENRSDFIRDAVYEKLQRAGLRIPRHLASAPGRTRKAHYVRGSMAPHTMNEKPEAGKGRSKIEQAAIDSMKEAVEQIESKPRKKG